MTSRKRQPKPVIRIRIRGRLSKKWIDRVLIPALRAAIDERDMVLIGGNSRQAAALKP